MVQISVLSTILFAGLAIASPLARRDVAQVKADITDISNKVTALDTSLSASLNYFSALDIDSKAKALKTSLDTATTDVKNVGNVTEADGAAIIAQVNAFEPTVESALSKLTAKHGDFKSLGVAGIAKTDTNDLKTSTDAFADALIAAAPTADQKAQGAALKTKIDNAFAPAVAAYASD